MNDKVLDPVHMPEFLKQGAPADEQVANALSNLAAPSTEAETQIQEALDRAISQGPGAFPAPIVTVMANSTFNMLTGQEQTLLGIEEELTKRSLQLIAEIKDCRLALEVVRQAKSKVTTPQRT